MVASPVLLHTESTGIIILTGIHLALDSYFSKFALQQCRICCKASKDTQVILAQLQILETLGLSLHIQPQ
jgi:hypothetical protein